MVVSDYVPAIDEIFNGLVYTYSDGSKELLDCVTNALSENDSRKKERTDLAEKIAKDHSFDARAQSIIEILIRCSIGSQSD